MIRYSFIAVLLIHSHSTNAEESFNHDVQIISADLQDEGERKFLKCMPPFARVGKMIGKVLPSKKREDILCDRLDDDGKQSVCNKIMLKLIGRSHGPVFRKFTDESPNFPFSLTVGTLNAYKCEERSIEGMNMKKRMFMCRARRFDRTDNIRGATMQGFYCAASRKTDGRVFAFKPPTTGGEGVSPFLEVDNVEEILDYVSKNPS